MKIIELEKEEYKNKPITRYKTDCVYEITERKSFDELLGVIEGFHEKWNNRFRISNICVFDYEKRAKGTGTALIQFMLKKAKECGARMSVLETQSSNVKAINFLK